MTLSFYVILICADNVLSTLYIFIPMILAMNCKICAVIYPQRLSNLPRDTQPVVLLGLKSRQTSSQKR